MIISHSKQFIFIKTRKTAGSALQKALALACEPGDLIVGAPALRPSWASASSLAPRRIHAGKDWIARQYPREWQRYTKITAERHPLDKVVSSYWWNMRGGVSHSFDDWFDARSDAQLVDFDLYGGAGGALLVDRVLQFTHLQSQYEALCADLDLETFTLQREKNGKRGDNRPSREYFSAERLARVKRIFWREIQVFGYHV